VKYQNLNGDNMSNLEIISGIITSATILTHHNIRTEYDPSDQGKKVSGSTTHSTVFRVNDTPCRFTGTPSLNLGDRVSVVGKRKGEFYVLVLLNETTNIRYTAKVQSSIVMYFCYLIGVIGIPCLIPPSTIFGIFLVCIGFIPAIKINKSRNEMDEAKQMLR
jgi:hypothetical protein